MSTSSRIVRTPDAPAPIGPYSQAIVVPNGRTLYASGQVGLDPATGTLVEGGVAAQAEQALRNLVAVLDAGGMRPADVVRCGIFLLRMDDFAAVNEVYARVFGEHPPARATVAVAELPAKALVEIDCVAVAAP